MKETEASRRRLQAFDLHELLDDQPPRKNINVFHLDGDYALRIAKIHDRFPAHRHPNGDEGWFVYRGRMRIDSRLGSVELQAGQGALVPKGVEHSPVCLDDETLVLVFNVRGLDIDPVDEEEFHQLGFEERDLHSSPDEGGDK